MSVFGINTGKCTETRADFAAECFAHPEFDLILDPFMQMKHEGVGYASDDRCVSQPAE